VEVGSWSKVQIWLAKPNHKTHEKFFLKPLAKFEK